MGERCPFCWGRNIKRIRPLVEDCPAGTNGHFMECADCEKWYRAKDGVEATALFMHCETAVLHPQRCYDEVREVVLSAGNGFPRRRWAEFNHLCAGCPNGRFVPNPDFQGRQKDVVRDAL